MLIGNQVTRMQDIRKPGHQEKINADCKINNANLQYVKLVIDHC